MASSSSSSPFAPTISSQSSKCHVFLSFRGVDTRKNFVDHLYSALEQKRIHTYKDDKKLPRGELIYSSLMKAIEESSIAVIVFSKNYANSSWCLEELEYIMKCRDTMGKIVMPIFHNVDPSVVRKQKWRYALAFFMHKLKNKKKAESWRKTLVYASNLAGWETKHIANGHEAEGIKEIVNVILANLHRDTSSVNDYLIGIEARMQPLLSNLKIGSGDVRMIGIWGMGGGGKTTLAASVYHQISGMFDCCYFVNGVRKESSIENGLVGLQVKMLFGLLKQKQVHARSIEEGRHMIMDRLCNKKVLIVLDDVDHLDQLEALAGSESWFGEGSRIIITTRDQHLLVAHRVNVIHNLCLLNDDEANKLLHKHAPRNGRPIEDYELLLQQFVSFAGGHPLALNVLGRFLCDKNLNEWRSALARLKEFPDYDIVERLKISFDALNPVEKELFLDIALFFRREHTREHVMMMLDDWGLHHVRGIKVLIRKGLISISDGKFGMHDLLQEMAHYINREEQQHSRVWRNEYDVNMCSIEDATTVGANMKKRGWFGLNIKQRDKVRYPLPKKFQSRELSGQTLSELVQKKLWEAYKAEADVSDHMLLPQTDDMDYHKSMALGHRGISHGCDVTADSDDEDGDRSLILMPKETKENEMMIERGILKRLEKGKNKVEMETSEDRILNRMEVVVHERMDRLENKMMERMDMLENRMAEIVVKRMMDNKTMEMEGGVVQRMERLTDLIDEMEHDPMP